MDVRRMMGRLNAASVKFDTGRGGLPELTPQDIAGAIGMIRNTLARDILMLLWWPDGAALTRTEIEGAIRGQVLAEYAARRRAEQCAKLELHLVEGNIHAKRFPSKEDERLLVAARAAVSSCRASAWPDVMANYHLIVAAALDEMSRPRHCAACGGRGTATSRVGLLFDCQKCGGTGDRPETKTWRAEQIGVTEQTYRKIWEPVYEWTYNLISGLERAAATHLRDALSENLGEMISSDSPKETA